MHDVGEGYQTPYPGGKNMWYRVPCTDPNCDYEAWEDLKHRAEKRVREHADAKNANESKTVDT